MLKLDNYFEGDEKGACTAVQEVMEGFWNTFAELIPADQGEKEVFDLELRKNLAEFRWQKKIKNRSQFKGGVALFIAATTFVISMIRHEENRLLGKHQALYAIHGEWSTRTIQLWKHVSGSNVNVIVLGRPIGSSNIKNFENLLKSQGIKTKELNLIRPYSFFAFKKTLVSALPEVKKFLTVLNSFSQYIGFSPDTKQLSKMIYRLLLGVSYKFWLSEQSVTADMCIFGHTGVADSGRLDHAFRDKGITTKHWFHGASHGQNFFGYSSLAICQSKHDMELTLRLGGYEKATYVSQSIPIPTEKKEEWLLMTNWLHPQNRSFKRFGVRDELMLLDQVACTAETLKFPPKKIIWKPHPIFYKLSLTVQQQVLTSVVSHGFQVWPDNAPFSSVSEYNVVLCTVSTTIIDSLKLGIVPLVHIFQPFDDVLYVNALPKFLLIKNSEQMVAAIRKLSVLENKKRYFTQAWHSLMPGATITTPENL